MRGIFGFEYLMNKLAGRKQHPQNSLHKLVQSRRRKGGYKKRKRRGLFKYSRKQKGGYMHLINYIGKKLMNPSLF